MPEHMQRPLALSRLLPPILDDAHKYSRGSLLILAGSRRFPGAAVLAAQAAARAGAGYVTLATPEPVVAIAQTHLLSIPVVAAPAEGGAFAAEAWENLRDQQTHLDAIALGPGLTLTPSTSAFVQAFIQDSAHTTMPSVLLDADALNILALLWQQGLIPEAACASWVLTPHAGELKRLCEATATPDAQKLAEKLGAVIVAKGPGTRVFSPFQEYRSTSGTAALAKAGTGDVLCGIIGSLLAQGAAPFDAAVLGVELHGRAGQLAEARLCRRAVCAEDVIESIPAALKTLETP
jgi:NAD(P)H-hydrate epimerase